MVECTESVRVFDDNGSLLGFLTGWPDHFSFFWTINLASRLCQSSGIRLQAVSPYGAYAEARQYADSQLKEG